MVAARSAAMGFNRLVDARLDALNPRTAMRELPRGAMSAREAVAFVVVAVGHLRRRRRSSSSALCGWLSPVALAIVFWYSLAKRYTSLHAGVSRAGDGGGAGRRMARGRRARGLGAVAARRGDRAVGRRVRRALRVPGPEAFDRAHGLHSIPVRFGIARSLWISRAMHVGRGGRAWRARAGRCRWARSISPASRSWRRCCLRAVAGQRRRPVAGETRLRPEWLRRHSLPRSRRRRRCWSDDG